MRIDNLRKRSNATLLPALLVAFVAGCGSGTGKDENKAAGQPKAALTVTAVRLQEASWTPAIPASGSLAAWQETAVGSEIGGLRLAEVRVNVGDVVEKGQLLAALSAAPVEADLAQARASLAEAEAAFAEAQANGDRARRFQGSGAISQQQITQYLTAEQTARARIDVAKARLQADELRLRQTRILAPDDGVISARVATVGTVPAVGQELFRLILKGRLEWRAEVAATEIGRIRPGVGASITLAGGGKVAGKVRAVAPAVDPQTRNGIVYVDLDRGARAGEAKAGMFARGEIELPKNAAPGRALTLPQSAVLLRDGFSYVFKLGADAGPDPAKASQAKVAQLKVSTGRRVGDRVEILDGLSAQDRVVESGVGFLADGDLVDVVDRPAPTPAAPAVPLASTAPKP